MKRIFLDANVLLEILFNRSLSDKCQALTSGPQNQYVISALTVHIVWYMAERYKLSAELVSDLLSVWEIAGISTRDVEMARENYDGKTLKTVYKHHVPKPPIAMRSLP